MKRQVVCVLVILEIVVFPILSMNVFKLTLCHKALFVSISMLTIRNNSTTTP